jgi:hypothetical protein
MSKKFLLNPNAAGQICKHPESGIAFRILPVKADLHDEIRRKSLKADGAVDYPKWGGEYAVAAIADWSPREGQDDATVFDDNGPVECNEANKRIFGRNQCVTIMPWIANKATGLNQFLVDEETAAKNA